MASCSSCGTEMSVGQLFCRECGARAAVQATNDTGNKIAEIKNRVLRASGKLNSGVQSTKKIGTSIANSLNSGKQISRAIASRLSDWINRRKKLLVYIAIGIGISGTYAVVQALMLNQNSPQAIVVKVVDAANSRDYEALLDKDLFPNSKSYPYLDQNLLGIYSDVELRVGQSESSLFSDTAFVDIVDEYDNTVTQVKLAAKNYWNFIFYQREWQVVSDAPTLAFSSGTLGKTQKLQIGDVTFKGNQDSKLRSLEGTLFIGFPGMVTVSSGDYGFEEASTDYVPVGGRSTTILSASEGDLYFPENVESLASTKADATASWCASTECSMLPYFSNSDYSWDSDPAWDLYYDYTYSSDAFTSRGCEQTSSTPTSATKGYVSFTCEIYGAKATVHVVDYYYLSDDYTYFNGTGTQYMSLKVNVSFNPNTGKFSTTSVTNY